MGKTKPKSSRPKGVKPTKPRRPWPDDARTIIGMLVLAIVAVAFCFISVGTFAAAKLSALYLFANDGKVSGRTGGDVKMRNGRSRGFTVPSLVRNGYTNFVRSTLSTFSSGWKGLTAAQRTAWNAITFKVKSNVFAIAYNVSGKSAYVGANINLTNVGSGAITSPAAPVGALDETITTLAAANGANTITYDATGLDANSKYLVFATAGLSAGISRPGRSKFRLLGVQPAPLLTVVTLTTLYNAKYGHVPATGTKVFLYTVPVNFTTGESGAGSAILSAIVT